MRQKPKPWEQVGMSRANWYRHSKPTAKPVRRPTVAEQAAFVKISLRTYQRCRRAFEHPLLKALLLAGKMKPGEADWLMAHPEALREFEAMTLARYKAATHAIDQ